MIEDQTLNTVEEPFPDIVVETTPDTVVGATPDTVVETTSDTVSLSVDHWPDNCDCSLMPRCFPHGWAHPFYTTRELTGCADHYHHDRVGENA